LAQTTEFLSDSGFIWSHEATPGGNRVARCGRCSWLAMFSAYEEADYRAGLHHITHHKASMHLAGKAWDRRRGQQRIEDLLNW
jgi:hypothetical protein